MNKLAGLALNEEGFVFDPTTGNSFTTNGIGLSIIHHLKDGKDSEQVLHALLEEFSIDQDTAQRDLIDFLAQLRMYNIYTGN